MQLDRTWRTAIALSLAAAACSNEKVGGNATATDGDRGAAAAINDGLAMTQAGQHPPALTMDAGAFANAVAASNRFEIESARLAASQAGSVEIKAFARQLRVDHEKSNMELEAAVARVIPPLTMGDELDAEHQAMLNQLRSAAGADFDRRFIDQQTNVHQKAQGLMQDYLGNGDSPPLKDFAGKTRTMVQDHLDHLDGIRK